MANVWNKLKASKSRSWFDAKCLISNNKNGILPTKETIKHYQVSSETLLEEDRQLYGLYLKIQPFCLERCRTCSRLLKPCVLAQHSGVCKKKNGTSLVKKNTFIPPNKKKSTKRSNKSTSEDDSESVISSENSSPALDSLEAQVNDSCVASIRDDSMIDVISVEEIASEDSKPPTPGPQDLYEEFTTPFSQEASNSFSSSLQTSDNSKSKPTLKLKIVSNKDANLRSHGTSLLEAHLLSNTKYNTSSGVSNVNVVKNPVFKHVHPTSLLEKAILKTDDITNQSNSLKSISSSKLKTDTKISIPISILPHNVKISPSMKKQSVLSKSVLSKTNLQKLVDSKERTDCVQSSSPFNIISENTSSIKSSATEYGKGKTSARSKKNKRSKGRNRSSKNADFDPDRHCGVQLDENRYCMRSLTCKTHSMSLRRSVGGRSKDFDRLLAEHRASKEALKDQDRLHNLNLAEPVISLPLLAVDKIAGSTIQVPTCNSSPDVVRVRVSNKSSGGENQKLQTEGDLRKGREDENVLSKKSSATSKQSVLSAALNSKPANSTVHSWSANGTTQSGTSVQNEKRELPLFNNDLKISFICSNMLYKVGGLLYTDRSRQAIRKCMFPLTSNGARQKAAISKPVHPRRKITDFLHLIKNTPKPPVKLSLHKEPKDDDFTTNGESRNRPQNSEELERMQTVLATSSKILGTLSTDENELRKLRLTRLKRSADRSRVNNGKRMKLESISDENYDINTLLSFDKSLLNRTSNDVPQYPIVSSDGFVCSFRSSTSNLGKEEAKFINQPLSSDTVPVSYNVVTPENGIRIGIGSANENIVNYQENDSQLWRVLETQIINSVGVGNIQELYSTTPLSSDFNNLLTPNSGYPESGENDIEETISKNYSLIEEYCKNITTDELLSDGKGNYEFYKNGNPLQIVEPEMKLNKNGANIINEHLYTNVSNSSVEVGNPICIPADGLNFDTRVLTSYLTSVASDNGTSVQNMNVNNISFVGSDLNALQLDLQPPIESSQEHVYEEILKFPNPY